jgi:hypothetical protein
VFATTAFADDPFLAQNGTGSNCVSQASTYWCASAATGIDPTTDDSTLEFLINAGKPDVQGISTFPTGWVEFGNSATSPTVIYDYLDFVTLGSGQQAIFLYCVNAYCGTNDAGAPSTLPVNPTIQLSIAPTSGGNSTNYAPPSSSSPGYGNNYANGVSASTGMASYTIGFDGSTSGASKTDVAVPEASSALLLGSMLFALAAFCGSLVIRGRFGLPVNS